LKPVDKWILSRLAVTVNEVIDSLEKFRFNEPVSSLYKFFWNDFCDWYLEWSKPRMKDEQDKYTAKAVLAFVLDAVLRLLHPFVPFITEAIYNNLRTLTPAIDLGIAKLQNSDVLVTAKLPERMEGLIDTEIQRQMGVVQNVIRSIRDIRSQYNIAPSKKLAVIVSGGASVNILTENQDLILQLANLESFAAKADAVKPANAAAVIIDDLNIFVDNVIDVNAEKDRLEKQKQQISGQLKSVEARLANENYVSRAKPEVVQETRDKLIELKEQLESVEKLLSDIG
jgi:valyl-tRNA synthetase